MPKAKIFTNGSAGVSVRDTGHVQVTPDWQKFVQQQEEGFEHEQVNVSDAATQIPDKHYMHDTIGNVHILIWPTGEIEAIPDSIWTSGAHSKWLEEHGFIEHDKAREPTPERAEKPPPVPVAPPKAEEPEEKGPPRPKRPRGRPGLRATQEELEVASKKAEALEEWLGLGRRS